MMNRNYDHGRRLARVRLLLAVAVVVVGGAAGTAWSFPAAAIASSPSPSSARPSTWGWPGADPQNSRDVGGPINASSVSKLGVAWTDPITAQAAFGGYATTPVVVGGVVYTQDLQSNVEAISLRTGRVLWTTTYNSLDAGPNGVAVVKGIVYGATDTSAFALRASHRKMRVDSMAGKIVCRSR